jgi:hypothetical protein
MKMKKFQYVYLVATSYSGSTLLSILMNAHPEIASVGELANSIGLSLNKQKSAHYHCSCGAEIGECSYWKEIKELCLWKGVTLDLHDFKTELDVGLGRNMGKLFFGLPDRFTHFQSIRNSFLWTAPVLGQILKSSISRNLLIARSVLDRNGKKIFFDVSKNATSAFYYARSKDIDFKLIHLVRDPRGLLNSAMKRQKDCDPGHVVKYWRRVHGSALSLRNVLDKKSYMLVHYERLCNNTDKTLADICKFIGVEPVDMVKAAVQKDCHIIGNRMRQKKFTGVKFDDGWQQNLTAGQIDSCIEMAGSLGGLFGYGKSVLHGNLQPRILQVVPGISVDSGMGHPSETQNERSV